MALDYTRGYINNCNTWEAHEQVKRQIEDTGFLNFTKLQFKIRIPQRLIRALVQHYNIETRCFEFNGRRISITLEDIVYITGLPVDGKPVTIDRDKNVNVFCMQYLGTRDPRYETSKHKNSIVKFDWLKQTFEKVKDGEVTDIHVRAYLLYLIGSAIVPDTTDGGVSASFLPLLEDLKKVKEYAWGAAMLAQLHLNMGSAKEKGLRDDSKSSVLVGSMLPLLVFAFERIPKIASFFTQNAPLPQRVPLMIEWSQKMYKCCNDKTKNPTEDQYLALFRELNESEIILMPYGRLQNVDDYYAQHAKLGMSRTVLICLSKAVYQRPEYCCRQFGIEAVKEESLRPIIRIGEISLVGPKGLHGRDWTIECKPRVDEWNLRHKCLIEEATQHARGGSSSDSRSHATSIPHPYPHHLHNRPANVHYPGYATYPSPQVCWFPNHPTPMSYPSYPMPYPYYPMPYPSTAMRWLPNHPIPMRSLPYQYQPTLHTEAVLPQQRPSIVLEERVASATTHHEEYQSPVVRQTLDESGSNIADYVSNKLKAASHSAQGTSDGHTPLEESCHVSTDLPDATTQQSIDRTSQVDSQIGSSVVRETLESQTYSTSKGLASSSRSQVQGDTSLKLTISEARYRFIADILLERLRQHEESALQDGNVMVGMEEEDLIQWYINAQNDRLHLTIDDGVEVQNNAIAAIKLMVEKDGSVDAITFGKGEKMIRYLVVRRMGRRVASTTMHQQSYQFQPTPSAEREVDGDDHGDEQEPQQPSVKSFNKKRVLKRKDLEIISDVIVREEVDKALEKACTRTVDSRRNSRRINDVVEEKKGKNAVVKEKKGKNVVVEDVNKKWDSKNAENVLPPDRQMKSIVKTQKSITRKQVTWLEDDFQHNFLSKPQGHLEKGHVNTEKVKRVW